MIHLLLKTRIENCNVDEIFSRFNRELFLQLSPPFPSSKLIRFDGCKKGDIVEVHLLLPLMKQRWVSEITDESHQAGVSHTFTDKGVILPFFLSKWEHHHRVDQDGKDVMITDDIHFAPKFPLPSFMISPAIRKVFTYRQPIYRKFFAAKSQDVTI